MRRTSTFKAALLSVLLTSTTTLAQTPIPAPSSTQPSTPDPSSQATAVAQTTTTTAAEEEKKEEAPVATQNARLAPGGVVAGGSSFPLRLQVTLDNAVGNGLFAPGWQAQPQFGTSVSVRPSFLIPKHDALPKMILSGGIDFSVANWLPSFSNFTTFDRQVMVSDAMASLILPGLFVEPVTGIALSVVVGARAPLSLFSRQNNLITNLGASLQLAWNSPETPVGSFFVQYVPSLRGNVYSQVGATTPCSSPRLPTPINNNPNDGVSDLPVYFGRDAEVLPNGECVLPGRQVLATMGNGINTGWSTNDGAHNVTIGLAWTWAFIRGLSNKPELSSDFASGQSFQESSGGSLSYTYTVPVDYRLFLTAGVWTQNLSAYTNSGDFRFPIYDFFTPANNLSSFFFDVTVGI